MIILVSALSTSLAGLIQIINSFNKGVPDKEPLISHHVGLILCSAVREAHTLERQINQFCEE